MADVGDLAVLGPLQREVADDSAQLSTEMSFMAAPLTNICTGVYIHEGRPCCSGCCCHHLSLPAR